MVEVSVVIPTYNRANYISQAIRSDIPRIIFVTAFVPSIVGHGGQHRSYQVHHDLACSVGEENVTLFEFPFWEELSAAEAISYRLSSRILQKFVYLSDFLLARGNLNRFLERVESREIAQRSQVLSPSLAKYEQLLVNKSEPKVCLIDNTFYSSILPINQKYQVPTLISAQNIESFEVAFLNPDRMGRRFSTMVHFAGELGVLAQCSERLFISKVETSLVNGLGITSHYYPYLPVGAIRQRMQAIRKQRRRSQIDPGLFLMVGSAGHTSTRESFEWFLRNAAAHGLPPGVRVIVAGRFAKRLMPNIMETPGIEIRGWLEQDQYEQLLASARGYLIPQLLGSGALTRLSELACAGVPAIVSKHPTLAVDLPPGIHPVDDDWSTWCAGIEQLRQAPPITPLNEYERWEAGQESTLQKMVNRYRE